MATILRIEPYHYFTLEEYFALEKASYARFEYWDGEIVCISDNSLVHAQISENAFFYLRKRLDDGSHQIFPGGLRIETPTLPPYRYPDASVACGELIYENIDGIDALINPTLIVEVLSPATALKARQTKFAAYKAIPTFSEYLLIAQDALHVTHYLKQQDDSWNQEDLTDIAAELSLESVGCRLSLQEIYEGVKLD